MALVDEAKQDIAKRLIFFPTMLDLLIPAFKKGGDADPSVAQKRDDGLSATYLAAQALSSWREFAAAESLLEQIWNAVTDGQLETKQRMYKALLALEFARTHYAAGDFASSVWWLLHCQADDALGGNPTGGVGRAWLRNLHGLSSAAIDAMNEIADACKGEAERFGDWSVAEGHPEEVVRRFAIDERHGPQSLQRAAGTRERPLSRAYLRALLAKISGDTNASSAAIGDALEQVATYLLLTLPGCVPRPKLLDQDQAFESDVVVRNLAPTPTFATELFGRQFLCECKNWSSPADAAAIGYLLFRMRQTHSKFGVIFSKKGVTGDVKQGKAARALLRRAFHEDGVTCVVINEEHLKQLADGELHSFSQILVNEMEYFQFGKQKRDTTQP